MIRMRQALKEFSNLLLVVLCDYVLGAMEYLLLEQPTHVALSNSTISLEFRHYYGGNVTLKNTSILLLEAGTNQTVAKKVLPQSQYEDIVVFECYHFKNAGTYWFRRVSEISNGTDTQWNEERLPLSVEWPEFHIDLRTSERLGNSLQLGLFTNEYLCPINKTVISLDVILTSSLYDLGKLISNETVGLRTRKELSLSRSQWVTVDCHVVGQSAYVAALLRSAKSHSVIASTGPVDIGHRFGYKIIVTQETICESSIVVSVIPPPCTSAAGHIAVFKDPLEPPSQKAPRIQENILNPEDNQTEFNCTLFNEGTNKYCFEFRRSSRIDSPPQAKECVLILRNIGHWSLWQAWSPCSVTCGDGVRERNRECLASFPVLLKQGCNGMHQEISPCSLEECSTTKSTPISTLHPEGSQGGSNNLVTVTGISLCLSIIFATILITLWRKLCKAQKCSTPVRCDSAHSPGFRKNSDEENICQERRQRESFSEGGEAPCSESLEIPLNFRRSCHFAQAEEQGGEVSGTESFQANAQKIIPPIFSYRLAQRQLKEMKKKGLTETTKVYHVSQNPLTDTMSTENQEAMATANKFRIKSPFLEQPPNHLNVSGERPCSRADFTLPQANPILSPSQTLIRQLRYQDRGEQPGMGYPRCSQFRRTASFHETRKAKPFRKRSMSTLPPRQTPLYPCRARTRDHVPEEQHQLKSKDIENIEELRLYHSTASTNEPLTYETQIPHKWEPPGKKTDLVSSRQTASQVLCVERPEQKRNKKVPFQNHRDIWRKETPTLAIRENQQRAKTLSPTQYRKSKCQSFPSDPKYHFYDNTSFGLTESELQIIDLPGYFGSNEEGETSTLSMEKLVL
uniref:thrombospondin type-1 domain-containing protein 1 n=1 Tax=Euleptes europaea TaxID=460621 RepID=UPI0025424C19|nr:thrombospondin type-1 domain-containing protein 1 [Euleptes europaea]